MWRRPDKKTALRDIQALLDAREWLPFDGAEFFAVVEKDAAAAREWAQRAAAIRGRLLAAERDGVGRALGTKDGFAALIAALGEAGRAAAIAFGSDKGAGADADDDGAAAETAPPPNAGAGAASVSGADFDEASWLARCLDAAAAAARGRIDALLPLVKVRLAFLLFVCCFVFSFFFLFQSIDGAGPVRARARDGDGGRGRCAQPLRGSDVGARRSRSLGVG